MQLQKKLKINGKHIETNSDNTILQAASEIGITIPTMCYANGYEPFTSCMICVIEDTKTGRLLPACSTRVENNMEIETESQNVVSARQTALELLLSDHLGDCQAPCSIVCPAGMNIPLMNRLIAQKNFSKALQIVKQDIALPSILGYICPAPCEKACKRKQIDEAVSICLLKRFVAEEDISNGSWLPLVSNESGKKVAIIGSGPTGLASAWYLRQSGHQCHVFEKEQLIGGMLRFGALNENLPEKVLDAEIEVLKKIGITFHTGTIIDNNFLAVKLIIEYNAVIIASGSISTKDNVIYKDIEYSKTGIKTDSNTFETNIKGVFAGGNAIREQKMAVRAVGHGKSIAIAVNQYLSNQKVTGELKKFNSLAGKLTENDYQAYIIESKDFTRNKKKLEGFTEKEAIEEALRCLHCDCRKPNTCKLRDYATFYNAQQKKYPKPERKIITKILQPGNVVYEPQKCIKCGLCVQITEKMGNKFGMTFKGRGFALEISAPLNVNLMTAIAEAADICVTSCPTGALAFSNNEEGI